MKLTILFSLVVLMLWGQISLGNIPQNQIIEESITSKAFFAKEGYLWIVYQNGVSEQILPKTKIAKLYNTLTITSPGLVPKNFILYAQNEQKIIPNSDATGGTDLWLLNVETNESRPIKTNLQIIESSISQNAKKIIFITNTQEVWLMDLDVNSIKLIAKDIYSGVISHDGGLLALLKKSKKTFMKAELMDLILFNVATGEERLVKEGFWASNLRWFPSGDKLLFTSGFLTGVASFWIIDISNGNIQQLTNCNLSNKKEFIPVTNGNLHISPNGKKIAYETQYLPHEEEIWIISLDNLNNQGLPKCEKIVDGKLVAWLDGGKQLAYLENNLSNFNEINIEKVKSKNRKEYLQNETSNTSEEIDYDLHSEEPILNLTSNPKFRIPINPGDFYFSSFFDNDPKEGADAWKVWDCTTPYDKKSERTSYDGHKGTDLAASENVKIKAGADGEIYYREDGWPAGNVRSTDGLGYLGNQVRIDHGNEWTTFYGHMKESTVYGNIGNNSNYDRITITCGTEIGGVGTSGRSSGNHLHFQINKNGVPIDPFSGQCSNTSSLWVNQNEGNPTEECYQISLFTDVPFDHWARSWIEEVYHAKLMPDCGLYPLSFCPDEPVTRAYMAIYVVKGIYGTNYDPPAATGTVFNDVPRTHFAADCIEKLKSDGIISGCSTNPPLYCPDNTITRTEMAVYLLRARHGGSYVPPPATGTIFNDVPASFWGAKWIEQLYHEGITGGCSTNPPLYCPENEVTRAEMAVFLLKAFHNLVDDGDPRFVRFGTENYWHKATSGFARDMYWTYVNGNTVNNYVRWQPTLPVPGDYEVQVFIPGSDTETKSARYKIKADGIIHSSITVDQNSKTDDWITVGTCYFNGVGNGSEYLELTDATGEPANSSIKIGFDAARFIKRSSNSNCISYVPAESWKGEYFNNNALSGSPVMVRNDGSGFLSFDWGTGSPGAECGVGSDNFSVRWTRTVYFNEGNYYFTVTSDDGFRLYIDNSLKLDKWIIQAPTTYNVTVFMTKGNHTIKMEYFENGGGAVAKLSWNLISSSTVTVDDDGSGFYRYGTSSYWHKEYSLGYAGDMLWTYVNGNIVDNKAQWKPTLPGAGIYKIEVFIPRENAFTKSAKYSIKANDYIHTRTIDQSQYYDQWLLLGYYYFKSTNNGSEYVELTDATGETENTWHKIGFDAVRWTKTSGNMCGATGIDDDHPKELAKSAVIPEKFLLHQNFPNPFNPKTTICYELPKAITVEITIFNMAGQKIKTLVHGEQPVGIHSVEWDGQDDFGLPVASGTYVYMLKTSEFTQTRKCLLLK